MSLKKKSEDKLCPSYTCKTGAKLFGIVGKAGTVSYLETPITVTETFVKEVSDGVPPEQRFRFSGKCIEGGCSQWDAGSSRCTLAKKVIETIGQAHTELSNCAIRGKCRWYAQDGEKACFSCNEVLRNMEEHFFTA